MTKIKGKMKKASIGFWYMSLFCLLTACQNTVRPLDLKEFFLSKNELIQLLDLLEPSEKPEMNFHIQYSEYFNDSTAELRIYQNPKLPTNKLRVCNIWHYKNSNVFIYDTTCTLKVPDSLLSRDQQSPFFIPDAPQWTVLAKRRNQNMSFSKISSLLVYSDTLSNPFPELIPGR